MNGPRVKICGLTTPEDALLAASLGADYLGVIFAESPRRVDAARARAIRDAVPAAKLVGVFRDADPDDIASTVREAGINIVQLHGHESPETCDRVQRETGKPIIKTFNSNRVPGADALAAYATTSYFLFDTSKTHPPDAVQTDSRWNDVARIRRLGFRVFLAGGLVPANVRDAIVATEPFAVDVCRGVERAPGVKDALALERFIAAVRS